MKLKGGPPSIVKQLRVAHLYLYVVSYLMPHSNFAYLFMFILKHKRENNTQQ